jgi:hypothetical protein
MENIDTKRQRFVRIVERRVTKILDDLDSLGKCSNKKNYSYNDDDIRRIFGTIDKKVKDTKLLYKSNETSNNKFTLKI